MINRWKCASYGSQRAWESGGGEGERGRAGGAEGGGEGSGVMRGEREREGTGTRGSGVKDCASFFRIFARINRPGEGMRPGGKVI